VIGWALRYFLGVARCEICRAWTRFICIDCSLDTEVGHGLHVCPSRVCHAVHERHFCKRPGLLRNRREAVTPVDGGIIPQ
jgi:hypothetical protein